MKFRVVYKDVFADLEGYVAVEDGGFALEAGDGLGGILGGGGVGGGAGVRGGGGEGVGGVWGPDEGLVGGQIGGAEDVHARWTGEQGARRDGGGSPM